MLMFKRSFQRNNKIVCMATTRMIAHLINQRVLGEYAGLQLLMILLMRVTLDSVEIACEFMTEAGQVLGEVSPSSTSAVF
jgi:pre-mRNA-splicing factor CWC22